MPKMKYAVIALQQDEEPPADPPEDWVQDGVNYPKGDPPAGVQSSTEAVPEIKPPNYVPPDPLPAPEPPTDEAPEEPPPSEVQPAGSFR
jgi:hypothetical protein